ncbi:MAG: hypothetical protein OHK0029_34670 [Armatimonadaceae bacterium]
MLNSTQTLSRITGTLLMVVPVGFTALFTALNTCFDYPDILHRPAAEVLERFFHNSPVLLPLWYGMLLAALLFIPLSLLLDRLVGAKAGPATLGVLAGIVQAVGLSRWVFVVPMLAAAHQAPESTEATRSTVETVFTAFHYFAGVGLGEHLGYFFTGLWTLAVAVQLSHRSKILSGTGFVVGTGILMGMLEATGAAWAIASTAVFYLLWSVWMVALGICVLRGRLNSTLPSSQPAIPTPIRRRTAPLVVPFLVISAVALGISPATAQDAPSAPPIRELMVHGFRSPSIGLEYREGLLGYHAGLYPTIVDEKPGGGSRTTNFLKVGVTAYVLPVRLSQGRPSEVFVSAAYTRGLKNGWGNGFFAETGFRWAVTSGLDLRLGVGFLFDENHAPRVNPTPGISWRIRL